MKNIIIICEAGWILCGTVVKTMEQKIGLKNAYIVRRWTNGRGIGALSKAEFIHEYMLDEIGTVEVYTNKVIYTIDCEWECIDK